MQVQLRTVLQHAWAEFEHDIRYKGTVPAEHASEFDRRFTLAAGLLELADQEFSAIRERLRGAAPTETAGDDPRIAPGELAAFLAGQYADAGWSRTDHYAWISGLLLELGITTLVELAELCAPPTRRRSARGWTTATRRARCAVWTTHCSRPSASATSACTATRTDANCWPPASTGSQEPRPANSVLSLDGQAGTVALGLRATARAAQVTIGWSNSPPDVSGFTSRNARTRASSSARSSGEITSVCECVPMVAVSDSAVRRCRCGKRSSSTGPNPA